jgi:hypothetical protein
MAYHFVICSFKHNFYVTSLFLVDLIFSFFLLFDNVLSGTLFLEDFLCNFLFYIWPHIQIIIIIIIIIIVYHNWFIYFLYFEHRANCNIKYSKYYNIRCVVSQ